MSAYPESLRLLAGSYGASTPPLHHAPAVVLYAPAGALNGTAAGLSQQQWTQTRHAAAARALQRRGLDPVRAWWAAIPLVGHWAYEVAWGRAEWDYAVGNIRATGWNGPVHYLRGSDDAEPRPYRAYTSLDEGVEDNLRLAVDSARYRPAFLRLLESEARGPFLVQSDGRSVWFPFDVAQWQSDLTHAGWHPPSEGSRATFRSTVTRVANYVGAPRVEEPPSAVMPVLAGAGVGAVALAAWWLWPR